MVKKSKRLRCTDHVARRNEEQLQVFERRILRKIFGPICDNDIYDNGE